jgi:hypothetical protein
MGTALTSTPHFRAASACESSCEVTSRNTYHFYSGVSCRRLRRLPFSIISSSWSRAGQPPRIGVKNDPTSITKSDANQGAKQGAKAGVGWWQADELLTWRAAGSIE